MGVQFRFKNEKSPVFGVIHRPVAEVQLKHLKSEIWQPITMLIDTGADYTLLPKFFASPLGVNLRRDCQQIATNGVGGKSNVYLLKNLIEAKLGNLKRNIPIGFLDSNYIPPLLGRQKFFETFKVIFERFTVSFS